MPKVGLKIMARILIENNLQPSEPGSQQPSTSTAEADQKELQSLQERFDAVEALADSHQHVSQQAMKGINKPAAAVLHKGAL